MAATLRRAVTRELVLARKLEEVRSLQIQGKNPKGKDVEVLFSAS